MSDIQKINAGSEKMKLNSHFEYSKTQAYLWVCQFLQEYLTNIQSRVGIWKPYLMHTSETDLNTLISDLQKLHNSGCHPHNLYFLKQFWYFSNIGKMVYEDGMIWIMLTFLMEPLVPLVPWIDHKHLPKPDRGSKIQD